MAVERKELLEVATDALRDIGLSIPYQVRDIRITYFQKVDDIWRVNISYSKNIGEIWWPTSAALVINATTGEVTLFKKGWGWK